MFYKPAEYDLLHTFPGHFQNKTSHGSIEVSVANQNPSYFQMLSGPKKFQRVGLIKGYLSLSLRALRLMVAQKETSCCVFTVNIMRL